MYPSLTTPLETSILSGQTDSRLQVLQSPFITLAKGVALIKLLPTALRFWEALGLGPKHGRKDATILLITDGGSEPDLEQASKWLEALSIGYRVSRTPLSV
jgi:mediator of RNA polymerase II transcription subunit 13, fungi type